MFQTTNNSKFVSEVPRKNTFSENDWHVLAGFWHPVAFSHEIEDKP